MSIYFCSVNPGEHIGEFIKNKLKDEGRTITWFAKNMGFTRQNAQNWLNRSEFLPSEFLKVKEAVGDSKFFDEFFENNPKMKGYYHDGAKEAPETKEELNYQRTGMGYTLRIEVDPEDFNPEEWDRLGKGLEAMKKAMKK